MVLTRLLFAIACVLLWTAVTACASADPASQPTSTEAEPQRSETQNVASLAAPSPTAETGAQSSAQVEPTPMPIAADTSDSEIDCDDDANRCNPACMNNSPASRMFLPEVGDEAYGFNLPSASGEDHSLASYRGESNVVLVFYRAFW